MINHDFSMDIIQSKNQQVMILRNPSLRRDFLFMACLVFLFFIGINKSYSQGVQGLVRDQASHQPLSGVQIDFLKKDSVLASVKTDDAGRFSFVTLTTGQVQLVLSAEGFESLLLDNVSLDGYTTHSLEFNLDRLAFEFEGVTVFAAQGVSDPGTQRITKEDLNTIPGNFDDPLRVAHSKPGIVPLNDQANHFSARGYSPVFNTWYLEGLQIANPNHTSNAGLLYDRPGQFGGGVNMFSAQILGSTDVYTGISPMAIHRTGGAAINLSLVETAKPEWRAKAGLIGFELGGGTAFGKGSVLDFNLRYSFTGLLANMGVDFGGEKIGFYDGVISYLSTGEKYKLKIFGWAGRSTNEFEHVEYGALLEQHKDFFDIDFGNTILGGGLRYDATISSSLFFRGGASYSTNMTSYSILGHYPTSVPNTNEDAQLSLVSSFADFTWQISDRFGMTSGLQVLVRDYKTEKFFSHPFGEVTSLRPYVLSTFSIASNLRMEAGIDVFSSLIKNNSITPGVRFTMRFYSDENNMLFAGYRRGATDIMQGEIFINKRRNGILDNFETGWELTGKKHNLGFTLYYQVMHNILVYLYSDPGNYISDFPYLGLAELPLELSFAARSQHYGAEGQWKYFDRKGWKMEVNQTYFKSGRATPDSALTSGRYDNRFTTNVALSKEVFKVKKDKNRIWNFSLRGLIHGGLREPTIDPGQSNLIDQTVFRYPGNFNQKLPLFKRIDLSVARIIAHPKVRWRYALEIQNAFSFTNIAYHYYDPFLERIESQEQLGIIPVLSVQASW